MKFKIALLIGLMSASIFARYNPQHFNLHLGIKNSKVTPGILMTMCSNAPMYFALPDGSRDYVRDVTFNISQRKAGNDVKYDVDYDITTYNNKHTIQTKGTQKDTVEPILQQTFPEVFTSAGDDRRYMLSDLRSSEADRVVFRSAVKLINSFLPPTAQLQVDEKDFSEIQINEWRAWIYPSGWGNWWQWERERRRNPN